MDRIPRPNGFRLAPNPTRPALVHALARAAEWTLSLDALAAIYDDVRVADGRDFVERALDRLSIGIDVEPSDLTRIPQDGGALVVANHPFGGVEGLVLSRVLHALRPDTRVLANHLLRRVPELHGRMLFVDPFGGPGAAARNVSPLREAVRWARGGGVLGLFPAGAVSHFQPRTGQIEDPPWSLHLARLVRLAGVPVVPVYFGGANGPLFHVLGMVHPRLRTALLGRELINKQGRTLEVRIGRPIMPDALAALEDDAALVESLRFRTYLLAARPPRAQVAVPAGPAEGTLERLAAPSERATLRAEVARLPDAARLVRSGRFTVYRADAAQIPETLLEIGRLREIAFRAVGEGSGRARDLDEFDRHYVHLFLWDEEAGDVIGAYRLGPTDSILEQRGTAGLYTATLFRYRRELFDRVGPALELGRSFVRPEYQRSFSSLLLLWKGIGRFVVDNPRYRHLFGPVSISASYSGAARGLIVETLRKNLLDRDLARFVRPRTPWRGRKHAGFPVVRRGAASLDELAALVGEVDREARDVPILLRQYLRLGGRALGFNVDPAFQDCLDVLVLVDLCAAERKTLERYFGDGLDAFLAHHRPVPDGLSA